MAVQTSTVNKPTWVDLSSPDPKASQEFYSKLFGWQMDVNDDPLYGGYARARAEGKDAAGIGGIPPGAPEGMPPVWALYIGTDDLAELSRKVQAAGGSVMAPAFDVGDQGRMAVFQDPTGAVISAWQPMKMGGFQTSGTNAWGWAELNSRDIDKAIPFYEKAFGWTHRTSDAGDGTEYTEFLKDGESILGALPMNAMMPAEVPSYWGVYFNVDNVDDAFRKAVAAGGREMVAPQDFPGGRFAILSDPQGAQFGLLQYKGS